MDAANLVALVTGQGRPAASRPANRPLAAPADTFDALLASARTGGTRAERAPASVTCHARVEGQRPRVAAAPGARMRTPAVHAGQAGDRPPAAHPKTSSAPEAVEERARTARQADRKDDPATVAARNGGTRTPAEQTAVPAETAQDVQPAAAADGGEQAGIGQDGRETHDVTRGAAETAPVSPPAAHDGQAVIIAQAGGLWSMATATDAGGAARQLEDADDGTTFEPSSLPEPGHPVGEVEASENQRSGPRAMPGTGTGAIDVDLSVGDQADRDAGRSVTAAEDAWRQETAAAAGDVQPAAPAPAERSAPWLSADRQQAREWLGAALRDAAAASAGHDGSREPVAPGAAASLAGGPHGIGLESGRAGEEGEKIRPASTETLRGQMFSMTDTESVSVAAGSTSSGEAGGGHERQAPGERWPAGSREVAGTSALSGSRPLAETAPASTPRPAAAPGATAGTPAFDEHVQQQVVRAVSLAWRGGVGEARVRLTPEHLGEVTVSLRVERGAVSAVLQAETPAAAEWIQRHEQDLRQGLQAQGLDLERLEVSADGRRQSQGEAQPRHRRAAPPRDASGGERFTLEA